MTRLKKRLMELFFIDNPVNYENSDIEYYGVQIRIYSEQFIRVTEYYNVITVDFLLDTKLNRYDIYEKDGYDFDGIRFKERELFSKYPNRQFEIREYPDGLRIYTNEDDVILFAEV